MGAVSQHSPEFTESACVKREVEVGGMCSRRRRGLTLTQEKHCKTRVFSRSMCDTTRHDEEEGLKKGRGKVTNQQVKRKLEEFEFAGEIW